MNFTVQSITICLLVLVFVCSAMQNGKPSNSDQPTAVSPPTTSSVVKLPKGNVKGIGEFLSHSDLASWSRSTRAFHQALQTSLAERESSKKLNRNIRRFVESLHPQWIKEYQFLLPGLDVHAIIKRFLCGHDALLDFSTMRDIEEFETLKKQFDLHHTQFPNHLMCDAVSGGYGNQFVIRFRELYKRFKQMFAARNGAPVLPKRFQLVMEQIGAQVGDPRLAPISSSVPWNIRTELQQGTFMQGSVLVVAREEVAAIHDMIGQFREANAGNVSGLIGEGDRRFIWNIDTEDKKSFLQDLCRLIQDYESHREGR